MLHSIEIGRIFPHPKNPRTDLGDLTELADSIKSAGILQNLTIIPKDHADYLKKTLSKRRYTGDYTVIIGHRRIAAARLAGLSEVPCIVAEMDEKTQIATMLLENMQRSDLTPYEEAQHIQLMLDYDETVQTIAEKTGFSQSTIRKRVKLLDLDKEKFKAAEARGATLSDYAELDKIEDIELKNKVLETIGTANFKYNLKQAIDEEKKAAKFVDLLDWCDTFAAQVESGDGYKHVTTFNVYSSSPAKPEDAGTVKYFYCVVGNSIYLLRETTEHETAAEAEKAATEQKRDTHYAMLQEIAKRAYALRREYILSLNPKKHIPAIIKHAALSLLKDGTKWNSQINFAELAGISEDEDDESGTQEPIHPKILRQIADAPEMSLLVAIYSGLSDSENKQCFNFHCKYSENDTLTRIYTFLEELGYEMSDEEQQLMNGTHELYM